MVENEMHHKLLHKSYHQNWALHMYNADGNLNTNY